MKGSNLVRSFVFLLLAPSMVACTGPASTLTEEETLAEESVEEEEVEEEAVVMDILAAAPDSAQLLLENDWVRVVQFHLEPGESLPAHEGRERVVFSVTDARILWTEGDAEPREVEWQAGDVHTHEAEVHSLENIGEAPIRWIVFARLDAAIPDHQQEEHHDVAESDGEVAEVLFEDDLARVIRVTLEPGESTHPHEGGYRVIYSLTDYAIEFVMDDQAPEEMTWTAGEVHWHEADRHQVSNIGETRAEYLVVQFRQ